jgi:predicted NAD/FAD-binding protein
MLFGIARFNRMALRWLKAPRHDQSLGSFLREAGIPRQTVDRYVLPMGAAVWSTSPANMFHMPAAFFLSFFENHGFLSINDRPRWRVVTGGSKTYVSALLKAFKGTLHRQNEVVSVRRDDEGCTVVDRKGAQHRFDQVVFACHSDEALGLLSDASLDERQILGAIPYASNRVLIHSDPSFMPRRRLAWASWNYLTSQTNRDQLCVTYHMNRLQQFKADEEFFVTLNPPRAVARGTLIKELTYHHPQFVEGSAEAQASWKVISGHRRTHFCGAYWRYGFHEDGVWSALRVCQALGAIDD